MGSSSAPSKRSWQSLVNIILLRYSSVLYLEFNLKGHRGKGSSTLPFADESMMGSKHWGSKRLTLGPFSWDVTPRGHPGSASEPHDCVHLMDWEYLRIIFMHLYLYLWKRKWMHRAESGVETYLWNFHWSLMLDCCSIAAHGPLHPHNWSISGGWNVWATQFAPWPSKLPLSPVSCRWCCSFSSSFSSWGLDIQHVRRFISWLIQLCLWPYLSLSLSLSLPLRKYIYNEIINKQTNKYSWYMQLPSMIIYDHLWHLCMSTSWLNHLCWRRGLHGLGRHGLRLLAMGWGRRVLTWMLWNYFIVFLTRVIFVHGTSWYDCTFHIWTGNLILCFKILDIRLGNSVIENRK